jgi:aspartate/methionine/tyrosine aminotransferase
VAYPLFLAKLLIRTGLARLLPGVRRLVGDGTGFLHYYSDRLLAAPHAELIEAAALLEPQAPDAIDLATGTPRFDCGAGRPGPDRYGCAPPGGLPELREAVAGKVFAEHGLTLHPTQEVLVTPGAAGAFSVALDAFVNPGDRVVLFDPTCPFYPLALRQRRARIRWVRTTVEAGRVRFPLDRLARALHRARLLVLADPVNPTGATFTAEDLEQIAWWADHHDALIFLDESYGRFRYEGERVPLGALAKARRRTLLAGSVSKGHALASARVGWLSGHRHLVRPCAATAALQAASVPVLCQQVALAALRQDEDVFRPVLREFESRRRYARERLAAMGLRPAWPSGAFFFWMPVAGLGLSGREFAARLLRAKKVLVAPGELFGPSGAGHVRLSYAADDGRLREGLTRLADFVRQLQGAPAAAERESPVAA